MDMNKESIYKIIKNLRSAGNYKDADALEKSINGEYNNTYFGIKISQFDDDFVDATPKLRRMQERNMGGDKLSPNEKQFIGRHTPIGAYPAKLDRRSNWGKLKIDTDYNPEPFGEDVLLHGVNYRDPSQIERAVSPESIRDRWAHKGWPPSGIRVPGGFVTDIMPYHPEGAEEIYDPSLGFDIGFIPEDSGDFFFGSEEEFGEKFDSNISQSIRELWEEGVGYYGDRVDASMTAFNKNIQDFLPQYKMLSSNFITQTPGIICGNSPDVFSASIETGHKNLASTIKKRIEDIVGMMKSIRIKLESSAEFAEKQSLYFAKFQDDITSGKDIADGNPENWLKKLLLVYGNDMDVVADNPFGFDYANPLVQQTGFVRNILEPYKQTKKEAKERAVRPESTKTWDQLLGREFEPITVSGPEAARERKVIKDIDIWDELANLKGIPAIEAQSSPILFGYEQEIKYLVTLLAELQEVLDARNSGDINDLDMAVMSFFRTLTRHYDGHDIVNSSGKLSGRYGVGNEAKLEIYIKCLYLAKAYNAWRINQSGEGLDKFSPEMITGKERPQELRGKYQDTADTMSENYMRSTYPSSIDNVEAFDSSLEETACMKNITLRFAQVLDDAGLCHISDIIEK